MDAHLNAAFITSSGLIDAALAKTRFKYVRLLNLWDRVDETAKSLVIAGLKAVASDSCDDSRDAKDGQSSV